MTLVGPHRDDMAFYINGKEASVYGSQGQQRTTALSLKLAEIELIHEEIGEYPLLLLDDVLSELDKNRQTQLIETFQTKYKRLLRQPVLKALMSASCKILVSTMCETVKYHVKCEGVEGCHVYSFGWRKNYSRCRACSDF